MHHPTSPPALASTSPNVVRIPVNPQARLVAATRMLETRLAEQRDALAAWRAEIARLSTLLHSIGSQAEAVQHDLASLAPRLQASHLACLEAERRASALAG